MLYKSICCFDLTLLFYAFTIYSFVFSVESSISQEMEPNRLRTIDVFSPKVWSEFSAKESKNSDRLVKYWIQDLPEDRFDDALQHIEDCFLPDAPVSKYFGKCKT